MSISLARIGQSAPAIPAQQATSPAAEGGSEATKTPAAYGSTPAATVSISAQAKLAAAKAYAIKHGHDPDGLQDGK